MTRYIAKSQEGTVEFLLLPNRDGSGWQYVNLTDGHICPCKFASIAVVLVVNNMCYAVANFIFAYAKHYLRIRLCRRLGIEPTERNIAVMESLEYQSV